MNEERLLKILLSPHMSEKATSAASRSEYVFEVCCDATKFDVKKAIEFLFKVSVKSVRIVNVKSKPKRFGRVEGRSKAWKKAYVALQAGQQIDLAGTQ